jgi:hypothetical protein
MKLHISESEIEVDVGIVRIKLVSQLQFGDSCLWVIFGKQYGAKRSMSGSDGRSEAYDSGKLSVGSAEVITLVGFGTGKESGIGGFDIAGGEGRWTAALSVCGARHQEIKECDAQKTTNRETSSHLDAILRPEERASQR